MKDVISIIVPVYNTERYLAKCADTIMGQTYPALEIIFVNDGSSDNSPEMLKSYAAEDGRVKVITQNNQGLSAARNAGISAATGSYVMFVDSDDWIDKDTCESAIRFAKMSAADIVMWSYAREYQKDSYPVELFDGKDEVWHAEQAKDILRRLFGPIGKELACPQKVDSIVTVWGKLYRRELLTGELFENTWVIGSEDLLFNIPVFYKANTIAYIAKPMCHYQKENSRSLTHKYPPDLPERYAELQRRMQRFIDRKGLPQEYSEALENRCSLSIINFGLRLVEDNGKSQKSCMAELRRIRESKHYGAPLGKMPLCEFPIHWKFFFFCAKEKLYLPWLLLLRVMNHLRSRA